MNYERSCHHRSRPPPPVPTGRGTPCSRPGGSPNFSQAFSCSAISGSPAAQRVRSSLYDHFCCARDAAFRSGTLQETEPDALREPGSYVEQLRAPKPSSSLCIRRIIFPCSSGIAFPLFSRYLLRMKLCRGRARYLRRRRRHNIPDVLRGESRQANRDGFYNHR